MECTTYKDYLQITLSGSFQYFFCHYHIHRFRSQIRNNSYLNLISVAKTARTPLGAFDRRYNLKFSLNDWRNDSLGDSISRPDGTGFFPKIYHDDHYLTAVVRIHSSGTVKHSDPLIKGKATAGANTVFIYVSLIL